MDGNSFEHHRLKTAESKAACSAGYSHATANFVSRCLPVAVTLTGYFSPSVSEKRQVAGNPQNTFFYLLCLFPTQRVQTGQQHLPL